jgi:hypothetical protein
VSHESLEDRVHVVEREQVRQGMKLDALSIDMSKVNAGVDKLLERESKRGEPMKFATIGATASALVGTAVVVWWLIAQSPAVQDLQKRLDRLDDKETGRVTRLESELWRTTVRTSP